MLSPYKEMKPITATDVENSFKTKEYLDSLVETNRLIQEGVDAIIKPHLDEIKKLLDKEMKCP